MTLALELAPVRVNNVAVDVTPTPGIGELPEVKAPIGRNGHVDDTAGAVLYLAGPLSGFVTGTTIHVDGGNLAAAGWHRTPARGGAPERRWGDAEGRPTPWGRGSAAGRPPRRAGRCAPRRGC